MNKKTLYVSDMDGTLLGNDSRVSPATAGIISELSDRGAMITVATARTPATVEPLLAATHTNSPAIVMTGAAMWDRKRREMVNERLFAPGVAEVIDRRFKAHGVDPFVYVVADRRHLDVYHGVEMNRHENDFYQERRHLQLKKFHLGMQVPEGLFDRSILLFGIGDAARLGALADELRQRDDCSVSCYPDLHSSGTALIEVFGAGVSKAVAVRELARMTGAGRIVVFGDNLNDLPMMGVADVAVAVDNAFDHVKEQADIVIGPNSADSVARYIRSDFDGLQ